MNSFTNRLTDSENQLMIIKGKKGGGGGEGRH